MSKNRKRNKKEELITEYVAEALAHFEASVFFFWLCDQEERRGSVGDFTAQTSYNARTVNGQIIPLLLKAELIEKSQNGIIKLTETGEKVKEKIDEKLR